jgi:hypothetical protein
MCLIAWGRVGMPLASFSIHASSAASSSGESRTLIGVLVPVAGRPSFFFGVWLDLLIVGLEVAMVVTAGTKAARPVARFPNPALITAFAWSAGLNGFAFSANQDAVIWKAVAAVLGVSIPVLIYLGTRTWAALTIESRRAA